MASKQFRVKSTGLSTRNLVAILMVIGTVLIVASFLLSKELVADIRFNQKVITEKNKANATLKKNVDSLGELKTNFESLKKDGPNPETVLLALPVKIDYAGLASEYEKMAVTAGARLTGISLQSSTGLTSSNFATTTPFSGDGSSAAGNAQSTSVGPKSYQLQIQVEGPYASVQAFTRSIETNIKPLRIDTVKISGTEPNVSGSYVVKSFFQAVTDVKPQKKVVR